MNKKITELKRTSLVYLEDIYKSYGEGSLKKIILEDIDLAIKEHEFLTLVGPSGCGKSTLLRLILGQELPDSGTLLIDNEHGGHADSRRGIVYQKYSLFIHLTVLENVMLGLMLPDNFFQRLKNKKNYKKEVMHYLEKVNLAEHANKYPKELSGGMQQRVAIAQALIKKPKILLMDEPFGALDPGIREDMQVLISEIWEQQNMTIIFVTHDLEEAVYVGTRLIVLSPKWEDDRINTGKKGATILIDKFIKNHAVSTNIKKTAEFAKLVQEIRTEGFETEYLKHVKKFDLSHPDSFHTLPK